MEDAQEQGENSGFTPVLSAPSLSCPLLCLPYPSPSLSATPFPILMVFSSPDILPFPTKLCFMLPQPSLTVLQKDGTCSPTSPHKAKGPLRQQKHDSALSFLCFLCLSEHVVVLFVPLYPQNKFYLVFVFLLSHIGTSEVEHRGFHRGGRREG